MYTIRTIQEQLEPLLQKALEENKEVVFELPTMDSDDVSDSFSLEHKVEISRDEWLSIYFNVERRVTSKEVARTHDSDREQAELDYHIYDINLYYYRDGTMNVDFWDDSKDSPYKELMNVAERFADKFKFTY